MRTCRADLPRGLPLAFPVMSPPRLRASLPRLSRALFPAAVVVLAAMVPAALWAGEPRPLVFVHVMPWYEAPPQAPGWGWHWTMNRFRPGGDEEGRATIASHYSPAIGPYDSSDDDVIEYQTLSMRVAGVDGVIVDWYGSADFRDHAALHRATERIVAGAERAGLSFALCYEDQTVTALVEAGRVPAESRVEHAAGELRRLAGDWFGRPAHARLAGRPLLLSFGHAGLDDDEWSCVLETIGTPVTYLSEHRRRPAAGGAFDWPIPAEGVAATKAFVERSRGQATSMPVAYPRFHDIYAEAGVHASWGRIDDADGATFRDTLALALSSGAEIVQVATWNDWGEGTQIEPSREHGTRDLAVLQGARRARDGAFPWEPADLVLPERLLAARRTGAERSALDRAAAAIVAGDAALARRLLPEGGTD